MLQHLWMIKHASGTVMAGNTNLQPRDNENLRQAGSEIKPPRNRTKATVTKAERNGRQVVIKDFSRCGRLIKVCYGRPTLRREARAYALLQGVAGIPECPGLENRDRLIIEYIGGRRLGSFKRGELKADVFEQLDTIIAQAHARGVAIGDVHKSNIIITANGHVFLIDFAHAVFFRTTSRPGLIVWLVMELDRHAAARMRARYLCLPAPEPRGLFGGLYRLGRGLKSLTRRIKKLLKKGKDHAHSRGGR
jgi:tRNA A-37 threonylcarbamoyl transferase component Bud32